MLILLYVITIIMSLIIKDKKSNWMIYAGTLCLLLWTSKGTYADFVGYYDIFERINVTGFNVVGATPGWFILCRLFGILGFNYYGMSLILTFVACLLLHKLFSKFDANENVIWAVMLVFPLLINGIQIRFFFAMAIVTFGLKYLIFNNKFALLKYSICVLLASTIHSAAIIFIILILVLLYEKFRIKTNIVITVFVFGATVVGVRVVPLLAKIFLHQSQYDRYIANSYTRTSFKWTFAIVFCWMITLFLFKTINLITPIEIRKEYRELKYDIIYKRLLTILFLLGLTLPLLVYDRNFHRFIQLGYIIDAITFGIYWKYMGLKKYNYAGIRWKAFILFVLFFIPAIYSFEFVPVNAIAPLFKIVGFPSIFR